jgi:hypothetical protein
MDPAPLSATHVSIQRIIGFLVVVAAFVFGAVGVANAMAYDIKSPFQPGEVYIYGDETYEGGGDHPSIGAIAFDMIDSTYVGPSPVYAMGTGQIRLQCSHISGSSVLLHQVDGYEGTIRLVHLDVGSHPNWISTEWVDVEQGQYLGDLFADAIVPMNGDSCWQWSSGTHLHLDLPQAETMIDGVMWSTLYPNDRDLLTSTNTPYVPTTTTTSTTTTTAPPTTTTTAPPTTTTTLPPRSLDEPIVFCGGLPATHVGTPGDDEIVGTPGNDVIAGLQGNDIIDGGGGDDVICGGRGHDELFGGQGFDVIYGAQGDDLLVAANGELTLALRADTAGSRLFGGAGDDVMIGSSRWDRMQGGGGEDDMYGYEGRDWMRGGADADVLAGGANGDDLHGGNGTDLIFTTSGDVVSGGVSPFDLCDLRGGIPASMRSCERQR